MWLQCWTADPTLHPHWDSVCCLLGTGCVPVTDYLRHVSPPSYHALRHHGQPWYTAKYTNHEYAKINNVPGKNTK